MARRRITHGDGVAAINEVLASDDRSSASFTTAVRFLLEELAEVAPGNSVEVRVPPLGATQCIEGPRHTRGTPPNVVEMSPEVWFDLAIGFMNWGQAKDGYLVSCSGSRADLSSYLPLLDKIAG